LAALVAAACAAWAVGAGPAAAELRHVNATAEFGPSGTAATHFAEVNTLAYQQATHRLYVVDAVNSGGIYGFDRSAPGAFAPLSGFPLALPFHNLDSDVAVDNTTGSTAGDIYVTQDSPTVSSYDSTGASLPTVYQGVSEVCGVAVDSTGTLWGGNYPNSKAIEFTPGSPGIAGGIDVGTGAGRLCKLAFDPSNDDLYASSWSGDGVWQYTAASGYASGKRITSIANDRIAVNGAKHVVYLGGPSSNGKVQAFSTVTGELLETIEPPGQEVRGLAVDEATDTLFVAVANSNQVVEMPESNVPKATTGEPIEDAEVGGTVDPDGTGPIAECYFEFGTSTAYGSKQDCDQSLPINGPAAVTATLPGLAHETTYHYRLVVANAAAGTTNKAADRTLVVHNVKDLETKAASSVTYTGAHLNAAFVGTGEETHYFFEYGTSANYGSRIPLEPDEESVPASTGPVQVSVPVTGLATGTTFHFRVVAKNSQGTSFGNDLEFTTPAAVEDLQALAATELKRSSAQLNASFEGTGLETHYFFEYGTNFSFGSRAPLAPDEEAVPASTGPVQISAPVSGLGAGTNYQYRIVAKNSNGTSVSGIMELHTPPAVNSVETKDADKITKTSALLHGSYDGATNDTPPGPLESFHYYFEWGPTESYGHTTAPPPGVDGGAHAEIVEVSAPISGLEPSLTSSSPYHFRLVVSNATGTSYGPDRTFKTSPPDAPSVDGARAEAVQPTTATVSASIENGGFSSSYFVEYGPTVKYDHSTGTRALPAKNGGQSVHVDLDRLTPGTVVHYRVVATSEFGTGTSPDQTFTTPGPPSVDLSESSAGTDSAHLTVAVIANDRPTSVRFEYGKGESYGSTTDATEIEPSVVPQSVSVDLTGLQPGTTYHFRAVATNELGTTAAPDQVFNTQALSEPAKASEAKPPAHCKRGFVKHKGRCVKKHAKHKKHGKHGKQKKHPAHPKRSQR
jgi:hypothetical protein